jgi:hypothetical protein
MGDNIGSSYGIVCSNPAPPPPEGRDADLEHLYARLDDALARIERGARLLERALQARGR